MALSTITNYHFDSMYELGLFNKFHDAMKGARRSSIKGESDFNGGMSFKDAMDTVINKGCRWDSGNIQVEKAFIQGSVPFKRLPIKRARRSYAGSRPHVAAAIAGSPKCMMVKTKTDYQCPVVKMLVPLSYTCEVTEEQVYNFGAAVLAVIKELESKNKRVELTGIFHSEDYEGNNFTTTITLKKSTDQIGISDIAYPVCHPSVYRRLGFGVMERSPSFDITNNRYGYSQDASHKVTKNYDVVLKKIIFNSCYDQSNTALDYVTKQVNSQLEGVQG